MARIRRIPPFWLLLGAMSLVGTGLILTLTWQGIATWSDSGQYFTAARTLLAGDGLRTCSGGYLTLWPPLFPILIAALQTVGLTNFEAARAINAVAFGLIVFAAGALYRRSLKLPLLALLGAGAVLLSWPQVLWAIHALSETVFTLLVVAFIGLLGRFLERQEARTFILLIGVVALAPLQRYLGVALIVVGFVSLLLLWRAPLRQRIRQAVVFGGLAALPFLLWVVRNLLVSGTATGSRLPWTLATLSDNLGLFFHAWLDWLAPPRIGSKVTLTGSPLVDVLLLVGVVCWLLILYTRSDASQNRRIQLRLGLLLIMFAIYTVVVQFSASLVNFSSDAGRVAAPVYPLVILLILLGLEGGALWLDTQLSRRVGTLLLIALTAAWLILPAQKIVHEFGILTSGDGWLGFSSQAVRTSPLVAWAQPDQIVDPLYTNLDDPICINRGRFIQTISAVDPQQAEQQLLDSGAEHLTLIIFEADGRRRMRYAVDTFADRFQIKPLVVTDGEAGIYRLTRRE